MKGRDQCQAHKMETIQWELLLLPFQLQARGDTKHVRNERGKFFVSWALMGWRRNPGPSYLGFIHRILSTLLWRLWREAVKRAYSRDFHLCRTQIRVRGCAGATNAPKECSEEVSALLWISLPGFVPGPTALGCTLQAWVSMPFLIYSVISYPK